MNRLRAHVCFLQNLMISRRFTISPEKRVHMLIPFFPQWIYQRGHLLWRVQNIWTIFSNEKQRASILIDHSPNREEVSRSLMIMHNMSWDETRVLLLHSDAKAKLSISENVNNPTLDYLMDGDDDDLGAGWIDSVVLPKKQYQVIKRF